MAELNGGQVLAGCLAKEGVRFRQSGRGCIPSK